MNGLDFILLLVLSGLAGYSYFYRGLVQEVLSLAAWLIAFTVTISFLHPFSSIIANFVPYLDLRLAISMPLLFILSFIPILWINYLIIDSLNRQKILNSDRIIVTILAFIRGSIILIFILFLITLTDFLQTNQWWQSSIIIQQFTRIAAIIVQPLPSDIVQAFHF